MTNQDELLLRAQQVIRTLRTDLAARPRLQAEPVAIVGMACRFPGGSEDLASFWKMTVAGENAACDLPKNRWNTSIHKAAHPGQSAFRACFLSNPFAFDHEFFGISAREAMQMDPAQRLFLEVSWHALEDAGQTRRGLAGSDTAVFAGHTGVGEFLVDQLSSDSEIDVYIGTGTGTDVIAGRLSYLLDLQGPCAVVNTACSSSLVALHLARRSLLAGECRMAIAGGVNVLGPVSTQMAARMDFLAPDGRCKPFDRGADGFGRGEGCGVVVLKRLSDAIADHDRIHALIHGSAMNQDGKTNGLTAPSGRSQAALLRRALKDAGIKSSQIGYVEAHGTGTPLGDPIEVDALAEVLGDGTSPCGLGSAKANIGHLEGAAGIAGVIRTVLILKNATIPPVANFQSLNPHISIANTGLFIPLAAHPWTSEAAPRYAGVSSFGWSGTNAHVILGEAPEVRHLPHPKRTVQDVVVPVSADNPRSLSLLTTAMAQFALDLPTSDLEAFAWSAGTRRSHQALRFAVVGSDCKSISALLAGKAAQQVEKSQALPSEIIFIFSPTLTNSPQVIHDLRDEPVFQAAIDDCRRELGQARSATDEADLCTALQAYGPHETLVIQFAITKLMATWGIVPNVTYGNGVGTLSAALASGSLTLNRAITMAALGQTAAGMDVQEALAERQTNNSPSALLLVIGDGLEGVHLEDRSGITVVSALQHSKSSRRSLLEAVATLYEAGAEIKWDNLPANDQRLLSLPPYPFLYEKEAEAVQRSSTEAPDAWFFETEWIEAPLTPDRPARQTTWIILADLHGFAEQLARSIVRRGDDAILIPSPSASLEGGEQEAIAEALAAVRSSHQIAQPVVVLHLLALNLHRLAAHQEPHRRADEDSSTTLDPVLTTLMGLVQLSRGLDAIVESNDFSLWTLTSGVHPLQLLQASPDLLQAPLWGFASAAAAEHPDFWGGIIDVDSSLQLFDLDLLLDHCLDEDAENKAVLNNGMRYVPRLRQATPPPSAQVGIDPTGTYVITGAFGGIGLALAKWLIAAGARHLVLLARGIPSSSSALERTEAIDREVDTWRASGATVTYVNCDVADRPRMSAILTQLNASENPVRGILHAATELVWKPLIDLELGDLKTSFHAKGQGSLVLQELTHDLSLDFLVFFSSAAVSIATKYSAAYAAANSFMDGLALQLDETDQHR